MRKTFLLTLLLTLCGLSTAWAQAPVATPNEAITGLLNRIGGDGAADLFEIVIDENLAENGKDVFVITAQDSKPCIKGNTQLSVATGINWYLNHYAHINLTWNNLTTDLSQVTLPVPASEEKHVCNTTYRYDFNTCTFSYSMAFWTWERWQREIDWMALHGINAPLNLVGLDVVTRNFLKELGVSDADINAYIAGPGFIAWFAMNNLEGWGGTINSPSTGVDMSGNPEWWYTRQEQLCKNMLQRMRELGMQPVIPGFSGQIPNSLSNYSISGFSSSDVINGGTWAGGYTRPDILHPNSSSYATLAPIYYKHLEAIMGVSELYSMDPFHEGGLPDAVTNATCYPPIMAALDTYHNAVADAAKTSYNVGTEDDQAKWIIQYWQGIPQSGAFSAMSSYGDRFIGLDLFSDNIYAGNAAKWRDTGNNCYYQGRPYIYCMLHNFGGRSGMHGRLETTMDGYFQALANNNNCQGIGATPEGTETNPILYDMLFELPWMDVNNRPTADEWLEDYAYARYGVDNATAPNALAALQDLKKSVWDCKVNQQGTSEAVILARPNWTVNNVSSWSTSAIYWDTQDVLQAADKFYSIKDAVTANGGEDGIANYNYDFIDVVRQAMVDYAAELLPLINAARGDDAEYTRLYQLYLQLMLDLDEMLSYDENFKLERWTSLARNIAGEVDGTTENDRNWLEWNARTQVTVWSSGNTDLHDYSNRCWAGLIKDFHYERWKYFFENNGAAPNGGWFSGFEYPWTVDFNETYDLAGDYSQIVIPNDMTATEKAAQTFGKYFGRVKGATKNYIFPMGVARKATKSEVIPEVYRGQTVDLPLEIGKSVTITSVWVDLNNDGAKGNGETLTATDNQVAIPADATIGKTTAQVVYSDGTDITFNLALIEDITEDRTVTAKAGANGSVAIEGTNELSVTNTEAVKMTATANTGYNFESWTDAGGNVVSNDNPFVYYGKEAATFTANFIQDKWGVVACNGAFSGDIAGYKQFIHNLNFAYYNREAETIFETTTAPTEIFNTIPKIVNVPQGASFTVSYDNGDNDGLKYCYFRAFIDLNQDGDFDDEGELLKEVGTNGEQNTAVCSNTINVLLPYDMPLGITHMRLRFDGAWDNGNNPSGRGAKDASIRPVYEIIINVTEKSDKAATINVETNSTDWGTVEVWTDETPDGSTGTTWEVSANIPMYLRATKASEDVEFLGWYDHYGRLLTENLEHTMYAREDATYTARFRKALEIGGWQFEYRTNAADVILTRVNQSGNHDLVIPETVEILGEQCKIVGFDNGLFNDNKDLWSISLPSTIETLSNNVLFRTSVKGENTPTSSGDNNPDNKVQVIDLGFTLKNSEAWTIRATYKSDGVSTFNQWGSPLLYPNGNGTDTELFFLSNVNGWSSCWHVRSPFSGLGNDYFKDLTNTKIATFTALLENKGTGKAVITVTNSEGQSQTSSEVAFSYDNISAFSAKLPKGLDITDFEVLSGVEPDPFEGCTNLLDITIANGGCNGGYTVDGREFKNASGVVLHTLADAAKEDAIRALGELIDNTKTLMDVIATSIDPVGKTVEVAPKYKNLVGITDEEAENVYDNLINALYIYNNGGTADELQAAYNVLKPLYDALNAKKDRLLDGVYHINHDGVDLFVAYAEAYALTDLTGSENPGFRLFDAKLDNTWTGETSGDTKDTHKDLQNNAIAAKVAADELFTIVPNSEGTGYTISAQGLYMQTTGSQWCIQAFDTDIANAGVYLVEKSNVEDLYKLKSNKDDIQYINDWGPVFGNDQVDKPNLSTFSFTPVTEYTITIPESGYHPLCLPFNVILPDGVEAYNINVSNEYALMTGDGLLKIAGAGDVVKAGTPVLVKAVPDSDYTLEITMNNEGSNTYLSESVLCGSYVKKNVEIRDGYKQFVFDGGKWNKIESAYEIPANSCWVEFVEEPQRLDEGYYHINWKNGDTEKPIFIGYNDVTNDGNVAGYKMLAEGNYTTDYEGDKVFSIVPKAEGYSISAQGQYLKSLVFNDWKHAMFSDSEDDAGTYVFYNLTNAFIIQGVGTNDGVHNDYFHIYDMNDAGNYIVRNNPILQASTFTITPATNYPLTITSAGMATLCLPFNVVLPAGMTAYDLVEEDIDGDAEDGNDDGVHVCTMQPIAQARETLKAGTPVIVAATQGNHNLRITMEDYGAKTSRTGSLLRGNYMSQALVQGDTEKKFIFTSKDDVVGFYIMDAEGTIAANKCWMEWTVPAGANVRSLVIRFGNTTDIENVAVAPEHPAQPVIYNLAGQRLETPQRGINIINGRKIVVK